MCVDTKYAAPADPTVHVVTAPAARKVWTCEARQDPHTLAQESWEYDHQYPGFVSVGLPTSHTISRYATDTGALLGTTREFDAEYDAMGNPISVTTKRDDGAWRTTTRRYDGFGLAVVDTSVIGSDATMRHVSELTDPTSGALLSATDENGTIRSFTWDELGRPKTTVVQRPEDAAPGLLRRYSYDDDHFAQGRSVSVETFSDPVAPTDTTAVGRVTTSYLDELGRERFAHVNLGSDYADTLVVGKKLYDLQGRTIFQADAYPASQDDKTAYGTSRIFNPDGSLNAEVRAPGPQAYARLVDPVTEIYTTWYAHSFDNHLETTSIETADASITGSPQASVVRQATSTAIGRVVTRSTYQGSNRLEHEGFAYDALGNQTALVRFQDPTNLLQPVSWWWQFDSLGQVTSFQEPLSTPQARSYDSWGELTRVDWSPASPASSHSMVMTYDSLGRTLSTHEENDRVLDPLTMKTYAYDAPAATPMLAPTHVVGRLARASSSMGDEIVSYDGLGNVNARDYLDLDHVSYLERQGVHADGSQAWTALQLPDNAYATERMDYEYDSARQLRWMWFSNGTDTTELYNATAVDVWGRLRHATFGPTSFDADYADTGRRLPRAVAVHSPSGSRAIQFTGFDAVGRETERTELVPTQPGTLATTYDALGRLAATKRTNGVDSSRWAFSYDPLGNLTKLDDQVGSTGVSMSSDPTDHDRIYAIAFAGVPGACNVGYDSFGNVIAEPMRTGGFNQLTYFNGGDVRTINNDTYSATFSYDPFGDVQDLNVLKSGVVVRHDHHFGNLITQRYQASPTGKTTYLGRNFPGPGLEISRRGPTGPWIYQFADARGTRFTTDDHGNFVQDLQYAPFGEATSTGASAGTPGFTPDQWNDGDALDGFGLVQVGKRIYDPAVGRFLSRDALVIPRTAATTNPYAFAMNDPMNLSDPSGMDPCAENPGCSNSPVGGVVYGVESTVAAVASWAAHFWHSTGVQPPVHVSSDADVKLYSAAFHGQQVQLLVTDYITSNPDEGTIRTIAGTVGNISAIAGAGFSFGAGWVLCGTGIGCALGGPMVAISADIAGAHAQAMVTGDPPRSLIGQLAGARAQAIEEAAVGGFGLAAGIARAGLAAAGETGSEAVSATSDAARRAALAARFGTTAERTAVLERAITAEGGLNTSAKVAGQLAGQRSFIPTQSILDTIGSGVRVADPQGVAGQFMYRSAASFNGSHRMLEVLVHEASGQIRHVLFRSRIVP